MGIVPDRRDQFRRVEKWLWGELIQSLYLLFLPVAIAGFMAGACLVPVDHGMGFVLFIGLVGVGLLLAIILSGDVINERRLRWQRWRTFMEMELPSREAKKFANDVLLDFQIASKPFDPNSL
jgi:hypothetical protein